MEKSFNQFLQRWRHSPQLALTNQQRLKIKKGQLPCVIGQYGIVKWGVSCTLLRMVRIRKPANNFFSKNFNLGLGIGWKSH